MRILQIVPRLPPAMCGVGDYSLVLARALRDNHGINTQFIVADPAWESGKVELGFPVEVLRERSARELIRTIAADISNVSGIILQYSGYGFSKRGAPLWLRRAVKRLRQEFPGVLLMTMFHELYASGPITSSAFWIKPLQQMVLRSIARNSDAARTNRNAYAQWLAQVCGCDPQKIATFPVFSNLGECADFRPFVERQRRIVLFQPPAIESPHGKDYWECWRRLRDRWPDLATIAAGRCHGLPDDGSIECRGHVTAEEAHQILRDSMLTIVDYYDGYLAKSGFFAAYAAHGIGCFLPRMNRSEADGIWPGVHYLAGLDAGSKTDMSDVEDTARRLHDWYRPHSVMATTASYADTIEKAVHACG